MTVQIHRHSKSIILNHSFLPFVQDLKHRVIEDGGKSYVALKWDLGAYQKLKDIVPGCPHPMQTFYDWPLLKKINPPFLHQKSTAQFIVDNKRCLVMNSTGTGKTDAILYSADYMIQSGMIDKVLIVSPISTLNAVWGKSIENSFNKYNHAILYASKPKRIEILATNPTFAIINPQGLAVIAKELHKWVTPKTLIVIDEASIFRNATTNFYKVLITLLSPASRLVLSSATPCPNSPENAWALARLINFETPRYMGHWRKLVCREINFGGFKKYEPLPNSHLTVAKYLKPSIFFHKDLCTDIPEMTFNYREVELSEDQKKHFKKMKNEMVHEFGDGEKLTAINGADALTKLRQILCGVIKTGEDSYTPLDYSPRLKVLREIIDENGTKLILICPFKGILRDLRDQLKKDYSCEYVNGDVPFKERTEIFDRFQNTDEIRVLAVHPRVASFGINLQSSNALVFWSAIDSNDEHEQLLGRISRAGQKQHMTVTYLYGDKLEEKIYQRLEQRKTLQSDLLSLYKEAILA